MRMISLLNESNVNFEERKRAMLRREMNDAYKKHAMFTQKKNPMLEVLENLLNGKSEKDLNEENLLTLLDDELQAITLSEQDYNDNIQNSPNFLPHPVFNNIGHDHTKLQGFHHVESGAHQIQEAKSQIASSEEDELFGNERFDFEIPERFLKSFNRDLKDSKSFEADLEGLLAKKAFQKAVSTYSYHMQMAQNGFQLNQSQFSLIA
ncbi:hypothetical protein [Lysinibacillus sp. BW-2-10]|uniref:hypothetical protein n=1 Tax=Lysinibacillus sp. BW-2-10 TaxID=2590030 RepID=UPI00117DA61B|nr:hypothetical protein [Lysinibacillus sp. BW-2-10]TSI11745.1 hypothetical protein FJQ64_00020 [Lysinibacillus sp. BW-2-10]